MSDDSNDDPLIGRLVDGKYRVHGVIGRGGMGAVYRAEHERIGRAVALKVLLRGHGRGSASERRLYREARIAGALGHPNIVRIDDIGQLEDGAPFIVMELLEGESLATRIDREGPLPMEPLLAIVRQVLSALAAAHAKGVVHRDLKPDNVFLTKRADGTEIAKLLDFGVSKNVLLDETQLTRTGLVVGTPYYLSPEQARGRAVDGRTDVWAAGVLLYEGLTGHMPFEAQTYESLLARILEAPPVPPSIVRSAVPEVLDEIITRALAKSPDDRFDGAAEMDAALAAALPAVRAVPPEPRTSGVMPRRTGRTAPLGSMGGGGASPAPSPEPADAIEPGDISATWPRNRE